jgi:type IV secretory pathway VirJ component
MARRFRSAVALLAAALAPLGCREPVAVRLREADRLGTVRLYTPAGRREGLVFLFGADQRAAERVAGLGLDVVGVDLDAYLARLRSSDDGCHYLISELEDLSKRLQREQGAGAYRTPLLAGIGAGGTLAYAALAQAPAATIAGAAAVDPAPSLATKVPLCPGASAQPAPEGGFRYAPDAELPGWWEVDASGGGDAAARLVTLVERHLEKAPAPVDPALAGLPLVEYEVGRTSPLMAVIYSGDGGWRDLDKDIGETLAARGIPVVGVDCLRYFWQRKTPETLAADLASIVRSYGARWGAPNVALIGYSFGADVLPFAVNRLPPDVRARIRLLSLLGLEATAAFEFSVTGWLGVGEGDDVPVLPEVQRIDPALVQCFYGEDEDHSLCRDDALRATERVRTAGGHHFDGDYAALAARILDGLRARGALD